jgi:hypothetical protein
MCCVIRPPKLLTAGAKGEAAQNTVTLEYLRALITSLMERARKTKLPETLALLNHALMFAVRISIGPLTPAQQYEALTASAGAASTNQNQMQWLLGAYRSALELFFVKRNSKLNIKFFLDTIQRFPALGWGLLDSLLQCIPKAYSKHARTDVFALIDSIMNHRSVLVTNQPPLLLLLFVFFAWCGSDLRLCVWCCVCSLSSSCWLCSRNRCRLWAKL